jgi:DNA repair exonuclease SbcCD ATPase subunit/predicted MPP superfamily phosphohydrolase
MINKIDCNLQKIDYIYHIADIHIRNWKRHAEYKHIFTKLKKELKKLPKNSIITVGGDIVHAKTDMSPELIAMVDLFFTTLTDIAPTIVICGNHDTNLNNNHRLDALTPIIELLNKENLYYLRDSGVYQLGNVSITVMSLLDNPSRYTKALDVDLRVDKKIAMYHGTIQNSETDTGMILKQGLDAKIFDGYDLVLLGDIHKRQILKQNPYTFYPGSLVQQNFGESYDGHGYSITNVNTLETTFHDIQNDYGYFTLDLQDDIVPDDLPIGPKTTIRIRTKNISPAQLKRVTADVRKKYKCTDITAGIVGTSSATDTTQTDTFLEGDIHNIQYQNTLIAEQLILQQLDDELIHQVIAINTALNAALNNIDRVRNVVWKPKRFEFDNMFSYGENNVIDFERMNGTCGLFAPNHAGKSAVLDALCFCLFDHSFRASKAEQVLNNKKDSFRCKFNFMLNGHDYFIEKKATRYAKGPLKGKLRVDIDFWYIDEDGDIKSLNGEQRRDTDKAIQSYVGTFDDFILTALSLQNNNSNFIEKTQGERKDLLANFLDLKIFDQLTELANKEIRSSVVLLEEYQKQDFETRLADAESMKEKLEKQYENAKEYYESTTKVQMEDLNEEIIGWTEKIQATSADNLNIDQLNESRAKLQKQLDDLIPEVERYNKDLPVRERARDESLARIKSFDENLITQNATLYENNKRELQSVETKLERLKIVVSSKLEKLARLEEHEYDPNCSYCINNVFIKDAQQTKQDLEKDKVLVTELLKNRTDLTDFLVATKQYEDTFLEFKTLKQNHSLLESEYNSTQNRLNQLLNQEQRITFDIKEIDSKISLYEQNKQTIELNKKIQSQIEALKKTLQETKQEASESEHKLRDLHGKIKVSEQIINECNNSLIHMQELVEKVAAYEYYIKLVSRDGIPFNLISRAIPFIQNYVNNILSQVVDFTINLETDGKNINAFIIYDGNKWPLELASGMEKFMSSLAIRVALIKITNLPKPNFIAIDEGLGVLDSTNLNSMHAFFNQLKELFTFSLVISHIDVVRDMVDNILSIDIKDGFSSISYL